jgi:hypothetical protein
MICVNFVNMKANETAESILIVLRTIGRWILIAALILLGLFSIFFIYIKVDDYVGSRPRVIDEFLNIKLDEKLGDVLFRIEGLKPSQKDSKVKDESEIRYSNKDLSIRVDVKLGRVNGIVYQCKDNADYTVVNDIFCNDLGEKVLKKYKDIRILCEKDFVEIRVYDAVKYGVRYYMLSNKVVGFYVSKPSYLETLEGINWIKCE